MDEKRFWIDFAEGRISVPEMLERTEAEPALLDWLTKIADPKFKTTVSTIEIDEDGDKNYIHFDQPFDAKLQIYEYIYSGFASGKLGRYLNVHGYFSRILTTAFPEDGIVVDQTLEDKFRFMLDACPSYIGGPEVDQLLDELLETLPEGLSKACEAVQGEGQGAVWNSGQEVSPLGSGSRVAHCAFGKAHALCGAEEGKGEGIRNDPADPLRVRGPGHRRTAGRGSVYMKKAAHRGLWAAFRFMRKCM